MTDMGIDAKLQTAAHDGNLADRKRVMDERIQVFYQELKVFNDPSLEVELSGGVPVSVTTRLGRVDMKPIYALDGQRVGAWIVFTDKNPDANGDPVRHLLSVHLSDQGWVGTNGNPFCDFRGVNCIVEVITAIAAEQLRWNSKFIQSIKAPV